MINLIQTLSVYSPWTVLIIVIASIIIIFKLIDFGKKLWAKRDSFRQTAIQEGKAMEARAEEKEARLANGEARMSKLESDVSVLTELAQNQQELIELLIRSDELNIKSWIKAQHEKWIPLGCIDSQTLELLEQRFSIYTEEGGNSWAEKLVKELRALPTVTVVSIKDIHEEPRSED